MIYSSVPDETAKDLPGVSAQTRGLYHDASHLDRHVVELSVPKQPGPTEESTESDSKSIVHALLIGIDNYNETGFPGLEGAVLDAERVQKFLSSDLHVPTKYITTLQNEGATREAIVDAIKSLTSKNAIEKGDPILIYFAGHGSTIAAPSNWSNGSKIQVLVPHDARRNGVYAENIIPDRTLGGLLSQLAEAKGDNITVILDCCHSTSGTRGSGEGYVARGIELKQHDNDADAILHPMDAEEIQKWKNEAGGSRGVSLDDGFLNPSLRSHVLLAACGETQSALEKSRSGVFTAALLDLLRMKGVESLSYAGIIAVLGNLQLADGQQTPQCEGLYKDSRRLFNSRIRFSGYPQHSIHFDKDYDIYVLEAGEVHGITAGTEFTVYLSGIGILNQKPLGVLVVDKVGSNSSTLGPLYKNAAPLPPLPSGAVAILSRAAQPADPLLVHVQDDNNLLFVHDAIESAKRSDSGALWRIESVPEDRATLSIMLEDGKIAFRILDEHTRSLGMTKLRISVPPTIDDVAYALRTAAHYYWHFRRAPERSRIGNKVTMHVYQLEADRDEDLEVVFVPVVPLTDLLEQNGNKQEEIAKGKYAPWSVAVDSGSTSYGIHLRNTSKANLFLSAFYFDSGTLEIRKLYSSPSAASGALSDSPLQKEASLSLNYENGGGDPLRFVVSDDVDMELGYLRVFLSTAPFDLNIEQDGLSTGELRTRDVAPPSYKPRRTVDLWDVITLPIVQTKVKTKAA